MMITKKLLLLNAFGLLIGLGNQANAQWANVGTGQLTSSNGTNLTFVKDVNNNLYVSYYGGDNGSTGKVHKFNGSSWSLLGQSAGIALYSGLWANASGDVFYSIQDGNNSNKLSVNKYTNLNATWSSLGTNISSSNVLTQKVQNDPSTGNPIVSYLSSGAIRVTKYNGSSWVDLGTNPVLSTASNYTLPASFVGNNDSIYVVGQNSSGVFTVYKNAINASSTTAWTTVGAGAEYTGSTGGSQAIAITGDASNNLYLAFRDLGTNGGHLKVVKYSNGAWTTVGQTVGTGNSDYVAIALDASSNPVVSFENTGSGQDYKTYVYRYMSGQWVSLGAVSDNYGQYTGLVVVNDTPIVAYADGTALNGGNITVKRYTGTVVVNNCYTPQSLAASNIPQNTATLTWTNSTGGSAVQNYKYELRTSGLPGSGNTGLVDSNTQTALTKSYTNLTNGQTYYFSVRANCDTQSSAWITDTFSTILYQTVTLTGFNYDVIANGAYSGGNTALSSTTNAVDDPGANNTSGFAYFSQDYNGGTAALFPIALPLNRTLNVGVKSFKFANYDSVNVLKLTNNNEVDTLNFQTPASAKVVHLLAVSGSGSSNGDVKVLFSDGTTKLFSNQTFDDWYGGNAYYTTRRVNRVDGIPDAAASDGPNLYEYSFAMDNADTGKTISGVEFKKTTSSGYLNVFAISIEPSVATIIDTVLTVQTENSVTPEINTVGGTLQMESTITPTNAANLAVVWSIVPGTGTATISTTGLVTALTNGTVYAKAALSANSNITDSMEINISNQQVAVTGIQVQTVNNVAATITSNGGTLDLLATIYPTNANNQNVTWSIVPITGSASISATGVVTAQSNGMVYAKAVSQENQTIADSLVVTITNNTGNNTGVNDIVAQNNIKAFPSPAANEINILSQKSANYTYVMYNSVGQIMASGAFNGQSTQISLLGYASGNYFINIETNGKRGSIKFLKK